MVAIREAMDSSKFPLEEFIDSLMTHEIMIRDHDKDEEEDKKKKIIALKSSTYQEEEEELSNSELDDISLLTRRYKKEKKQPQEIFKGQFLKRVSPRNHVEAKKRQR